MNFYALNAAPINGWETHLGSGQAAMSLLASGESADVALGKGSAQLALTASGNGTRRVPAHGSAAMQLQASGNGTRRVPAHGSGTASMQLAAKGEGRIATRVHGYGKAVMELTAPRNTASQYRQIKGSGSAVMSLLARTRDNRVVMLPNGFFAAPHARSLRVDKETRAMRVPRQHAAHLHTEA